MTFHSGYVALVGRPNAGKSTLLNALLGERVAIVTPKAQTTRHRITGIHTDESAQIVFLDTPGFHESSKPLNRLMNEIVDAVIDDADIVCLLVEADRDDREVERELFARIGPEKGIVIVNKADLVPRERFEAIAQAIHDEWGAREVVVLSALKDEGVTTLLGLLAERLPEGPAFFPEEYYTDHPTRFLAAELIREELFLQMQQEIPYSTAVEIESFQEPEEEGGLTRIAATIIVEKESQKAMVIGKGGKRIKSIGTRARAKIEELVGGQVFLELFVKVVKDWTKDDAAVRRIYGEPRQG